MIDDALVEIGVLRQGQTAGANDATYGLKKLNRMLESWNLQGRKVYVIVHASLGVFPSSKQSYSIGRDGSPDFTADRPTRIIRANLLLTAGDPDTRIPLEVMNMATYADLTVPALSADIPTRLYYQPTIPNGTLWPWPFPTDLTNELELFTPEQLNSITTAGDSYDLPPGYEDAIVLSLAEAFCAPFSKTRTPELKEQARLARGSIESLNLKPPLLSSDFGAHERKVDNYRTGWFA